MRDKQLRLPCTSRRARLPKPSCTRVLPWRRLTSDIFARICFAKEVSAYPCSCVKIKFSPLNMGMPTPIHRIKWPNRSIFQSLRGWKCTLLGGYFFHFWWNNDLNSLAHISLPRWIRILPQTWIESRRVGLQHEVSFNCFCKLAQSLPCIRDQKLHAPGHMVGWCEVRYTSNNA